MINHCKNRKDKYFFNNLLIYTSLAVYMNNDLGVDSMKLSVIEHSQNPKFMRNKTLRNGNRFVDLVHLYTNHFIK